MSYECKLFIVSESNYVSNAEVLATFDLSGINYELRDIFKDNAECDLYSEYEDDFKIESDKYGFPIKAAKPETVIKILRTLNKREHYWRYKVAADLIAEIMRQCDTRDLDSIMVYSYGY